VTPSGSQGGERGHDGRGQQVERIRARLRTGSEEAEARIERGLGAPALFAIAAGAVGSAVYFVLGIVAQDALGLTPLAFLVAGVFFLLTVLTYLEGNSLHPERGGAAVFARYAFDELWSFVAGWAILLDFLIVMAIGSLAVAAHLDVFWSVPGDRGKGLVVAAVVLAWVVWANVRGQTAERYRLVLRLVLASAVLFAAIIGATLWQYHDFGALLDSIELGEAPTWEGLAFATVVASVVLTGIESASGLAGELRIGRGALRRVVGVAIVGVLVLYVGMALAAVLAVPVEGGTTRLGTDFVEAPLVGVVSQLDPEWLADWLRYVVGALGALVLVQAVNGQMLGIGRLTYSLGTHRQIPSLLSRLEKDRGTPYVAIGIAAAVAFALACSEDVEWLAGIFAFGATIAFTLAHLSIVVLRYREPDRPRAFRVPLSVRVGRGSVPLPSALGALLGAAAWVSVVILHEGARYVGGGWLLAGLLMYVVYRRVQGKSLTKVFTIPEEALREARDVEYGSILVPVFGERLDDDIVGTAGRLAAEQAEEGEGGAMLEVVYVFAIPMSLPIDARVPDERRQEARRALARAKQVGEEYAGVEVATAMVRGRTVGAAIVAEAKRRGVEAIVLAAEAPTRIRGGGILGGRGIGSDRFAGDLTRYVIEKAPCRVILTAPPAADGPDGGEPATAPEPVGP
jgi:basic amino acid/polyamine antiporter, APA family